MDSATDPSYFSYTVQSAQTHLTHNKQFLALQFCTLQLNAVQRVYALRSVQKKPSQSCKTLFWSEDTVACLAVLASWFKALGMANDPPALAPAENAFSVIDCSF